MKESSLIKSIRKVIKEMDTTSSSGTYNVPFSPGLKLWNKNVLLPYTEPLDGYDNAQLYVDALDGNISTKDAKQIEAKSLKLSKYYKNHPTDNDDDGDILNDAPGKPQKVNEDLGVWFGTKKKPKGSKQPKGPWVNICKKVDGKHPPCGRHEASDKSYPKCRAAGVAGKMTDSQKKSACQQKRKAEKTHSKTGTGNKPKMVSYKPKKKTNESVLIKQIIKSLK